MKFRPPLRVIEGGGEPLDTFTLREAMIAIEKTRAPNVRIRKRLMLEALQHAALSIYRDDPYRAKEKLEHVTRLINSTWPPKTGDAS